TTLLQAIPALANLKLDGDAQIGVDIVRKALEAPARQIADNAGQPGEVVIEKVKTLKIGEGFDALAGEDGDMFKKASGDARDGHSREGPGGRGRWPRPRRPRRHGLLDRACPSRRALALRSAARA